MLKNYQTFAKFVENLNAFKSKNIHFFYTLFGFLSHRTDLYLRRGLQCTLTKSLLESGSNLPESHSLPTGRENMEYRRAGPSTDTLKANRQSSSYQPYYLAKVLNIAKDNPHSKLPCYLRLVASTGILRPKLDKLLLGDDEDKVPERGFSGNPSELPSPANIGGNDPSLVDQADPNKKEL